MAASEMLEKWLELGQKQVHKNLLQLYRLDSDCGAKRFELHRRRNSEGIRQLHGKMYQKVSHSLLASEQMPLDGPISDRLIVVSVILDRRFADH